jgi:hypothetical protein
MSRFLTKKWIVGLVSIVVILAGGFFLFSYAKDNKISIAINSLSALNKISQLLPIQADTKKEISAVNDLVAVFTKNDNVEKSFLLLLQNNMELRPGGGFLGQYAVIKIKNGQVTYSYFEDANLLDQRITVKVAPPYPFTRMMQIKSWKFRDSNFSPNFPTNAEKAKYFFRLAGGNPNFDGVIAVNSDVLSHVLKLTGPITIPGFSGEYNSENAVLKLEEQVEKAYIMDPKLDTQNRKAIMKKMAAILIGKLTQLNNIPKVAELLLAEFRNKDLMMNFKNPELQKIVADVYWDGKVAYDWGSDYLMMVDANMGALKTDYYMRREINYHIDLDQEKPVVDLNILYKNTAPYGDWRTSDYHSYLRVYVPKGANLLEREMISYPNIQEENGKTSFGFIVHVLIGKQTNARLKYELPADFDKNNYRLLIQKQSGVGDVPVKVVIKKNGREFVQEQTMIKDLNFELK